jgi:hypothetical protein
VTSNQDAKPQLPHAASSASGAPWIEEAGVPRWRKLVASALIGFAFVLGAAGLAIYGFLMWSSPPDFGEGSSRQFRGMLFLYFFLPLLILFGPVWTANRIARRIDPSRPDD